MKITIESYGNKHSTETENDDLTMDEYIDIIIGLLVCNGFTRELIIKHLKETE